MGMLSQNRSPDHRAVVRDDPRVIRDQERAATRRHVGHAVGFDPPVLAIEPERDVFDAFGEFMVEAESVACEFLDLRTHYTESPHLVHYHELGLDMPLALQAAADEYLGWLQLEANRSPNTVRAYGAEIRRLLGFLAANGHSLIAEQLRHEDLRAFQRHLAGTLKNPSSRARALVAIRSWLRWLAREGLIERDLSNG